MCSYICTNQTVSPSCFDLPGPRNISACVAWRLAGGHHQHAAWSKMRVMTVMREVLRNPESRLGWSLTRGDYPVSDWLSFCMLQFQALGSSPGITRLSSPLEFGKVMVGIFGMSTRQIPWERSPQCVASMQEHILHHALLVDCHTLFPRDILCTQCTIFSPLPLRLCEDRMNSPARQLLPKCRVFGTGSDGEPPVEQRCQSLGENRGRWSTDGCNWSNLCC